MFHYESKIGFKLLDIGSALTDDHTGLCREYDDLYTVRSAFDLDLCDARAV